MGLENGEYILTMKESNSAIFSYFAVNGQHLMYCPDREYKLIVHNGIYTVCNEQYPEGIELLGISSFDWFNIKKVA